MTRAVAPPSPRRHYDWQPPPCTPQAGRSGPAAGQAGECQSDQCVVVMMMPVTVTVARPATGRRAAAMALKLAVA